MSSVMMLTDLEDTTLWKKLHKGFESTENEDVAQGLAVNLIDICKEASVRMKAVPTLHSQYTLHDETHLLRVTELMSKVMPDGMLEKLNPIEIALLILSAYFHDQGMILESEDLESLALTTKFKVSSENWAIEHPNLREIRQHLNDRNLSPEEKERCRRIEQELLDAQLTDYIRENHGRKSAEFVRSYDDNPLWNVVGTNLAYLVAKLCESHVKSAYDLTPENGFHYDQLVGTYKVNMPYLGLVLRLADILDLDRDRTPDALYRTIHFTSDASLAEWAKHRSVEGWEISHDVVRFDMKCEHPIYQRAALEFMDWINDELANAQSIVKSFPSDFQNYKLDLPNQTDISRIEPKDDAYIYHDLEFSLSRDEVVKLLMMEELYRSPSLCVRELLQNALDALRYRKVVSKRDNGTDWTLGKIEMEHTVDENGYEVLRCTDNGIGMDVNVIKRFLTNVGRSYYRSPEFEQERTTFRDAGVDFDPCSQFGIGFMSYFMIGDRVTIHTRRDYGPKRGLGDPLIVEINGFGGMIVIRKGLVDQDAGTTVGIFGRKKPSFFDEWEDKVRLIEVVDNYALACEFPISARCCITEIEGATDVLPEIVIRKTEMELAGIKSCTTLEQEFSEIDHQLGGRIRTSILLDKLGKPTITNDDAEWVPTEEKHNYCILRLLSSGNELKGTYHSNGQVCLDGILVCGKSDDVQRYHLPYWSNRIYSGKDFFVLDVRGALKPTLTPARNPPDTSLGFVRDASWKKLQFFANQARGRLWEKIAQYYEDESDCEVFWQLAMIHEAEISYMRTKKIWSCISVPLLREGSVVEWRRISSLGKLRVVQDGNTFKLITHDDAQVSAYDMLERWSKGTYININRMLKELVVGMSAVVLKDDELYLEIRDPIYPDQAPWECKLGNGAIALLFVGFPDDILSVQLPFPNANRDHTLVKIALEAKYSEELSEIQQFASLAVYRLSDSITNLIDYLERLPDDNNGYSMCRLGHQYQTLDWSRYSEKPCPPYNVWIKKYGCVQVNEEHFEKWAATKISLK